MARPFVIGPMDEVEIGVLAKRQVVQRYTDNRRGGGVRMPMPCHEGQEIIAADTREAYRAHCRVCGRAYDLTLIDENDGGWLAVFRVVDIEILLSHAPKRRRRTTSARR